MYSHGCRHIWYVHTYIQVLTYTQIFIYHVCMHKWRHIWLNTLRSSLLTVRTYTYELTYVHMCIHTYIIYIYMYADMSITYMFTYKCRHISLDRLRGSLLSTRTIYEVFHELSHELYHHNITLSSHFQKLYDMYDWIHSAAHFYQAAQYTNSFTNTLTNSIITMQTYKCWHINADIYCWLHSAAHSYQATQHDELHHKLEDLSMSNFTIWLSRTVWHMWLNVWCCSLLSSCTIYELCWRTLSFKYQQL